LPVNSTSKYDTNENLGFQDKQDANFVNFYLVNIADVETGGGGTSNIQP